MSSVVKAEAGEIARVEQSPARFIELAISQGADVEKLEKLMDLNERWEAKQAKQQFFEALGRFQSICPPIPKTKDGYDKRYKYAPLDKIIDVIKEPLRECGLSYRWEQEESGDLIKITCIITHVAGHSEQTGLASDPDASGSKNSIQARGSAVKYLQRYTLESALGITTTTDDDGISSGINPAQRLIQHNDAVRRNLESIMDIKAAIAMGEGERCAEAWFELSKEDKMALWVAPTKGGIFTTEERTYLKSDEFGTVRRAMGLNEKGEDE